jgi:putative hemolysin
MLHPGRPKYRARFAGSPDDVLAAQKLRYARFLAGDGPRDGIDSDVFDGRAKHVLIEDTPTGALVCCLRLLPFANGSEIARSYSAQHYELSKLARFPGPMLEIGRFCIAAGARDPDILRLAWVPLSDYVAEHGIELLFGCSSFRGTEIVGYEDAFALLEERHLAPRRWLPWVKAPSVFRFARKLRLRKPELRAAMRAMPPLLRTYLLMGGWVSDHAVVDRRLNTLHVFTGLEVRRVPPGRARLLRPAG